MIFLMGLRAVLIPDCRSPFVGSGGVGTTKGRERQRYAEVGELDRAGKAGKQAGRKGLSRADSQAKWPGSAFFVDIWPFDWYVIIQ